MRSLTLALLAVLALAGKRAFDLVLEKEYAIWAPALARLLVRAAGFVCWPRRERREQWSADLEYVQQVEDESGLLPAGWCLLSAPGLALRYIAVAFGATCWRQWEEHVSFPRGLLVAGVMGSLIVGAGLVWQGPPASLTSIAFSPDGKLFVSAGGDGTVRLWEASTGKPIGQPLTGHTSYVLGLAFSPDGKTIASAGDRTVRRWEASNGKPIASP